MNIRIGVYLITFLLVCDAYDNDDYEIFDLYEEVNGTFYELLNVTSDAPTSDIRKAYRKLSLVLHPDKNDADNAEEQFRQLVAVYEVLKDTKKREKYEEVLKNGLPSWRNPVYYYRKYRKMGTAEVSLLVALIATIGHYIAWWAAFLEKKFEMDEILAPIRKKREKKKAKGKLITEGIQDEMDTEELLEKELGYRKPTVFDLLPFVICRSMYGFIKSIPSYIHEVKQQRKLKQEQEQEKEREAAELAEAAKIVRPKKIKPQIVLQDASEFENEEYASTMFPTVGLNETSDVTVQKLKNTEWSEEDYAILAKLMAKYPGGTPSRWERIAWELGRSVDEVTNKVKSMKKTLANAGAKSSTSDANFLSSKKSVNLSDSLITKAIESEVKKTVFISDNDLYQSQYDVPDDYDEGFNPPEDEEPEIDYTVVKKKVKTRPPPEVDSSKNVTDEETENKEKEIDSWTQVQQKCLEAAMTQFPKSTSDRWTCIARAVPGKNKEQCIARIKLLADHVKKRKKEDAESK